jgi:hypothetical protein
MSIRSKLALVAALLALSGPASADGIFNPGGGSSLAIPNYTANSGLPNWKTCRQKVIANSPVTYCKVLLVGDSTNAGVDGSYNGSGSDARAFSVGSQMASILSTFYGLKASAASIVGPAGIGITGGSASTYAAYDARINPGTWDVSTAASPGIGGGFFNNVDATSALAFDPADSTTFPSNVLQTDTLDLIAIGYTTGGAGTINVSVNGGSTIGSLNTAVANFVEGTFSTTLGANVWDVKCSSASAFACLPTIWRAYNSTQSEVSIMNAGWSGAKTSDWTNTGASPTDPLSAITKIQPSLCVINLLINEWEALTPTATVSANTQTIITTCKNAGADVLLVSPNPSSPAPISLTGSISGHVLTVSAGGGSALAVGQTIVGSGVTVGTQITGSSTTNPTACSPNCTGAGGSGTYAVSSTLTVASEAMTAGVSYATQQTYVNLYKTLATSNNIPFLDMWTNLCGTLSGATCPSGGWQAGMGTAWNGVFGAAADVLHLSVAGYGRFAEFEAQVLMQ